MPRTGGVARRDKIVESAMRAFGGAGYGETSLDEIAEAVGIRKQSLLYYFPTKEDLLEAAAVRAARGLAGALEDALVADPTGLDRLDALVVGVLDLARDRPEVVALIREVARLGPPLSDRVTLALRPLIDAAVSWLDRAVEEGVVRPQNPRVTLLLVYSAVIGHITESNVKQAVLSGTDRKTADAELVAFLRAALASPRALQSDPAPPRRAAKRPAVRAGRTGAP